MKNKIIQNLGYIFCRNGFSVWFGGSFQLLNCALIFLKRKDCPLVALRIISQKCNISLFHLPTVADSAALLQKRGQVITSRLSMQCWWSPQSVVLNVARFSWSCCYSLPFCTNIFRTNSCATFMSLCKFITHTSCCCKTLFTATGEPPEE